MICVGPTRRPPKAAQWVTPIFLEVIRSATLSGAEALGQATDIGSLEVGKLADLVVVNENPLANFKVLYGTGHFKLGEDNKPKRSEGIRYTIKDGIIFEPQTLLSDVREIVKQAKLEAQTAP